MCRNWTQKTRDISGMRGPLIGLRPDHTSLSCQVAWKSKLQPYHRKVDKPFCELTPTCGCVFLQWCIQKINVAGEIWLETIQLWKDGTTFRLLCMKLLKSCLISRWGSPIKIDSIRTTSIGLNPQRNQLRKDANHEGNSSQNAYSCGNYHIGIPLLSRYTLSIQESTWSF